MTYTNLTTGRTTHSRLLNWYWQRIKLQAVEYSVLPGYQVYYEVGSGYTLSNDDLLALLTTKPG